MSYTKNTWETGDLITAAKLNNMEDGIADAGSGAAIVLTMDSGTFAFSKTWQEIHDAIAAGIPVVAGFEYDGDTFEATVTQTLVTNDQYQVKLGTDVTAVADSASGYPVLPNLG